MIDTGAPNQLDRIRSEFSDSVGISHVLATHHHEDHAGNGAQLQKHFDAKVYAPYRSLRYLRGMLHVMYRCWLVQEPRFQSSKQQCGPQLTR